MGRRDIISQIKLVVLLAKQAYTSSQSIQSTDVADFHGAGFVVDAGAWTDGSHTFEFQHRDAAEAYAAIPDADLGAAEPIIDDANDDDQQYYIPYLGNKEDIGVITTVSGTTTGAIYGVYVLKGFPSQFPVN